MELRPNKNEQKTVCMFTRLRSKIRMLKLDIFFLKQCKRERVFPNFIKTKCAVVNSRTEIVTSSSQKLWLKLELKHLYGKLSRIEIEAYELHLSLTKQMHSIDFDNLLSTIHDEMDPRYANKKLKLNKKLDKLKNEKFVNERERVKKLKTGIDTSQISFVTNLSTQSFTNDEMEILQKGLKFTPIPNKPNIIDLVADIETSIRFKTEPVKQDVREKVATTIKNFSIKKPPQRHQKFDAALMSLKKKDCLYMKSDKGRDIVIMDKSHYKEKVTETINNGSFILLKKKPATVNDSCYNQNVETSGRSF